MNKAYFATIDEAIDYAVNKKWTGYRIRREITVGGEIIFSVEKDEREIERGISNEKR